MIELFFIRHGATKGNLQRRYIGRTDEALCALGREQATALKEKAIHVDAVYVSPLRRARETAAILFPDQGYRAVEDFRETDFGIFEGKTADELSGDPQYRAWLDSGCRGNVPGGESVQEVNSRCRDAFLNIIRNTGDGESLAFVVHGGTIMSLMEAFARPKRDFYFWHINNGECIQARYLDGIITDARLAEDGRGDSGLE